MTTTHSRRFRTPLSDQPKRVTGFRTARIAAGYKTARAACDAYRKAKKGQGISLGYWRKLEANAPRLLNDFQARRFARFFECSVNILMRMAPADPQTNKEDAATLTLSQAELPGSATPPSQLSGRSLADLEPGGSKPSCRAGSKSPTCSARSESTLVEVV